MKTVFLKTLFSVIISVIWLFSASGACAAEDVLVWNQTPLTLILPVGKEVRVTFPVPVDIQVLVDTTQVLKSLAPNEQAIYWTALAPFEATRVVATSLDLKTVYLLDLVGQEGKHAEAYRIEDPERILAKQQDVVSDTPKETLHLNDPAEIILTRFASQSLYAPTRLIPVNPSIYSVEATEIPTDFPLLRSQYGERFSVEVVAAWSGFGQYITAVMITNETRVRVRINPARVNGNFSRVTAQHLIVTEKGTLSDRTTLYLISDVPFASAILEDGYGV